jgi:hypothetical protein
LLAGCSKQSEVAVTSQPPATNPAPAETYLQTPGDPAGITSQTTSPAPPDHAGPGNPVPPPVASAAIYELAQDGKIYVFGFVDHMLAFQHGGKNQPVVIEKPNFTPKGTTVVIEASDDATAAEILASYLKQHPEIKK